MTKTAIDKIKAEFKEAKLSAKGKAVGKSVVDTLIGFCEQNCEFAQTIAQSSETVGKCIESTVKGCGGSISDIEVYRKAAEFYFSGATVHFNMTIDLGDNGFSNKPSEEDQRIAELHGIGAPTVLSTKTSGALQLSLDDLLM